MLPKQLTSSRFAGYPPQARALAEANLAVLAQLPLVLAASLLREVISFDWLFPAEQAVIRGQFSSLGSLSQQQRAAAVAPFAALTMPASLSEFDWVNQPKRFLEELTAYLWSSKQIDAFHAAAVSYAATVHDETASPEPPLPRTSIVMLPRELEKAGYPLFRKLRPHGVFFEKITPGWQGDALVAWVHERATRHPSALSHFYVDGGSPLACDAAFVEVMSWSHSTPVRNDLLRRLRQMLATPGVGPEKARSLMAAMNPEDLGLTGSGKDAVMAHFLVSVLTEGSGAQIFSTTFAQWTARELLRRAQPTTLLVRFGSRQQLQPMNEMLSGMAPRSDPDFAGSLVDADMGAYYTWINQQRLSGAGNARFLAISEARGQAVAIGPGLPQGTTSTDPLSMDKLLGLLS